MKSIDLLYDLLLDKTRGQEFYNGMMVRMVNPAAREVFKTLRNQDESHLVEIRRQFLSLEAKPQLVRLLFRGNEKELK